MRDLSNEVSTLQFAMLCTHIVVSAAKSVIQSYRPALTGESESTSLSGKSSNTDSTTPSSRSSAERFSESLVAKHLHSAEPQTSRLSQICDISIGCMHVIGRIISLYQSGISPSDSLTPIELSVVTNQTVHVMQEMDRIIHSSRGSSRRCLKLKHLEESDETSFPQSVNEGNDESGFHSETHTQMLHSSFHTDDSDAAPRKQVDIDSCTDETVDNILDLHKNEVQLSESAPSEDRKISQSVCLHPSDQSDLNIFGRQETDEVISSDCVSVLNQPEDDTSTVPSEMLLNMANELVLLKSAQIVACCTLSQRDSFPGSSSSSASPEPSSRDLHSAAADVAGSVVEASDSYVESKHPALTPVNSGSDELSCLDDLSHVEDLQSLLENSEQAEPERTDDVSTTGKILMVALDVTDGSSAGRADHKSSDLLNQKSEPSPQTSETLLAQPEHIAPSREPIAKHVSHIEDLTISCTNDAIVRFLNLYQSDISRSDSLTPTELSVWTNQTLNMMQELEKIICSFRGSSKRCLKLKHLEECDEISFSESVNEGNDVSGFHSSHQTESLFSDRFHDKATQAISDVLFKTCEKMFSTMSNPPTKTSKSVTSQSGLQIIFKMSFSSELYVHSAASEITKTLMKGLHRMSSSQVDNGSVTEPVVSAKNFRSAAVRLYRNVHHKVFGLLLRLEKSCSAKHCKISQSACLHPPEQTEAPRNDGISAKDFKSPGASATTSRGAGTTTMREALETRSISSQDCETESSSSSPVKESCSLNPVTVAVKKSRCGFGFILDKRAPLSSITLKKSTKAFPAGEMSDSGQCASSSGNQHSSQRESTVRPFRKAHKRLSRILAAVRRALPNPFQCMTRPC
ncbi:hypothetical protein MHYP_G00094270 [Metynnis hypsauchen]